MDVDTLGSKGLTPAGRNNRDGIGAVVRFTPRGGAPAMQPILGGSSHSSQDSLTAHFGLGRARRGTVEVRWPGGVRNRLYDVASGERVRMPEIPCSYAAPRRGFAQYSRCVQRALGDLVRARAITRGESLRLALSAGRAFFDR